MSTKTVAFKQPTALPKPADAWVGTSQPVPLKEPKLEGPTKRLTVDIPEELHRRIKVDCAGKGIQISDVVRDLLASAFPGSDAALK
ncbi:MAG: hypothetical protein APF80_13445 [Alphaproteobacteria bacterium BRH_c36]|nr:MAG: hypothetical protein APF80_13445 [Alphaproteobacteria bacterium BRH_c36]